MATDNQPNKLTSTSLSERKAIAIPKKNLTLTL